MYGMGLLARSPMVVEALLKWLQTGVPYANAVNTYLVVRSPICHLARTYDVDVPQSAPFRLEGTRVKLCYATQCPIRFFVATRRT